MRFRLVATEQRVAASGARYNHTIWMGEFDAFDTEEHEAFQMARDKLGPGCSILVEPIPTVLH